MRKNQGFTLIELITVMAISAILLTIITIPVVQGFNFTRAAQAFTDGQARGRAAVALVTRDISNASLVRDNTGDKGALNVILPGQDGSPELVRMESVKLDFYKPAEGDPGDVSIGPNGERVFVNPDTGKADPTLQAPKGDVNLPAAPGLVLVRYFIALRDPFSPYVNPYDRLLQASASGRDNLVVLYRAEAPVYEWDPAVGEYVVNADLFFDQDYDNDTATGGPLLDDPNFMVDDGTLPATYVTTPPGWGNPGAASVGTPNKAQMIQNWLSRAEIVTEVSRFDMIMPVYDRNTRQVHYVGNVPEVVPLVRFQPTRMTNEPAQGLLAQRTGEETFNADKIGPDQFRTDYGSWASLFMRALPSVVPSTWGHGGGESLAGDVQPSWAQGALGSNQPYIVGRTRNPAGLDPGGFSIFLVDPATQSETTGGTELFDLTEYERALAADEPYPFTRAVNLATFRSGWLSNAAMRREAQLFAPNPKAGRVLASFPIQEVGLGLGPAPAYDERVPTLATGLPYTPDNDPDVAAGTWTDATFRPINRRFNKLWTDWATLFPNLPREDYCKRFMDLRVVNQPDGALSPLNPSNGFGRASITPGSETVIGPDQRPGNNYGRYTRYTRTTQRPVGPNQYLINYTHLREPDWVAAGILGAVPAGFYDPSVYTANSAASALLQAPYREGYVEFNSSKNTPLPEGNIYVSYRFQFTEPNDIVAVDYDSSEVMEFVLSIRNFPQSTNPEPQMITLKGSADVRNFLR